MLGGGGGGPTVFSRRSLANCSPLPLSCWAHVGVGRAPLELGNLCTEADRAVAVFRLS